MGRLIRVVADIAGVKVLADFEVIRIVDDVDPYPTLLGLDWAIDMGGIINIKRRSMIFENGGTRVIVPLDLAEGERYTKSIREEEDTDHIYKLTAQDDDWINPMTDGMICWEKYSECLFDSDEEIEN